MEESIPYRNTKLLIKTIPKGTLLFRITKTPINDTRGVPISEKERCITPNFNVYFHPTPFSGHYMYKQYAKDMGDTVHIYTLKQDIKVLLLINPSKYTRLDRIKSRIFLKPCSTIRKGCMPRKGNSYDTCVSDTIIEKHPEVVGLLGISVGDNKSLRESIAKGINRKTFKRLRFVKDASKHRGIPELTLHPLTRRPNKDILVHDGDKLDNNYKLLKSVTYNEDYLNKFMDKHAVFDEETNFYTYKS